MLSSLKLNTLHEIWSKSLKESRYIAGNNNQMTIQLLRLITYLWLLPFSNCSFNIHIYCLHFSLLNITSFFYTDEVVHLKSLTQTNPSRLHRIWDKKLNLFNQEIKFVLFFVLQFVLFFQFNIINFPTRWNHTA